MSAFSDAAVPLRWLLLGIVGLAAVAFLSLGILDPPLGPGALHGFLALAVMPLIFAAMVYFTPVLTRSRPPPVAILLAPAGALLAGIGAVLALHGHGAFLLPAAVLGMGAAGGLMAWMLHRERHCFGAANPCLHWYVAALAVLILALSTLLAGAWWPAEWQALRLVHLHLNTLGFVGLAAVGTLRVLLPTAAGYTEAGTMRRLQRDLAPMAAGAVLVAVGAAWVPVLAWVGVALWAAAPVRLVLEVLGEHRPKVWGWHYTATLQATALLGLLATMVAGALATVGLLPARAVLDLYLMVFLLPLIVGAASHLIPLWLWPGRSDGRSRAVAEYLARWSGGRAALFAGSGGAAALGATWAATVAAVGVAWFLGQVAGALIWPPE